MCGLPCSMTKDWPFNANSSMTIYQIFTKLGTYFFCNMFLKVKENRATYLHFTMVFVISVKRII